MTLLNEWTDSEAYPMPNDVPRGYQTEVFERAQKENIIAALNTGSGKTMISLLLIRWMTAKSSSNGKLVVFLVPKVTLVEQQYQYLRKRATPLRINKFYGAADTMPSFTDRPRWKLILDNTDVLVLTAQIFLNLLTHSLWSFDKVSLMVFDECHHARKNHPYNGIMREYFQVADISKRPKIFGMTASPVWNTKNPLSSITTLEANMHAKVISVMENVEELLEYSPKANEEVKYYPAAPENFNYPSPTIYDCLKIIDHCTWDQLDLPWAKVAVRYSSTLLNLGPYCASMFLFLEVQYHVEAFLAENKNRMIQSGQDGPIDMVPLLTGKPIPEDLLLIIDILHEYSSFFPLNSTALTVPISVTLDWCTPKVKVLVDLLADYYDRTPSFQGIIFVEQRQMASTLAKILPAIPELSGKIKCAFIVGEGVNREGVSKQTDKFSGNPVQLFRERTVNILIATSVAEEGLDFPDCELVVRFDNLHDMVGYVQSRGRARNKEAARFLVMIQENNKAQAEKFLSLQTEEPRMNREYQTRHPKLPEVEEDENDDEEYANEAMYQADLRERERYVEPSTGAMITYDNALNLLSYLCSLIPRDAFTPTHQAKFTEGFQTSLLLPRALPLESADLMYMGPLKRSYKEAKRAVAFMAVKRLRELDVFDDYLLPAPISTDDFEGNLQDLRGQKARRKNIPVMLTVPVRDPWCMGDRLWLHPIVVDDQILAGLVTGTALVPEEVNVADKHVKTLPAKLLHFDTESEHELRAEMKEFTRLAVWYNATSRSFSPSLSFYVVPITDKWDPDFVEIRRLLDNPRGSTDWAQISDAHYGKVIIVNSYRFGSTYLLRNIRQDLSPMSSPLPGSRESHHPTYHDFWITKWSTKTRQANVPIDGPLLETSLLPRSNMGSYSLNPSPEDLLPIQSAMDGRLLPQKTSMWLPLSFSVRQAFEVLPALCHRMTNTYRTRCVRAELRLPFIEDKLMIEAFSIPSTTLPFNNQRLETLGDAVLQLCTTVHLLNEYPHRHEGQLTKLRQKLVANNYLMHRALDLGVDRFVNSEGPSVYTWRYVLPEDTSAYQEGATPIRYVTREYPRRSLQDCMEALLGASFLTGGIAASLEMGTALGLGFGGPLPWHMRYTLGQQPSDVAALFLGLEHSLGYKFRHNHLLLESLSHPSVTYSEAPSYQRLEFLGDAILDLVVIKYLYDKYPEATSHQLALPRTKAICAPTLANIAVRKLGLHNRILLNSLELSRAIDQYVPLLENVSGEEIVRLGWKFDPPKVLSDVFESLLGAVLVDSGYDYEKTASVVEYIMEDVLEALSPAVAKDPVSELTEWVAGKGCRKMVFKQQLKSTELWERLGIAVLVHNQVVVGPIVSTSLTVAKFMAAERALTTLRDPGSSNSLALLCDCGMSMDAIASQLPSSPPIQAGDLLGNDDAEDTIDMLKLDDLEQVDLMEL